MRLRPHLATSPCMLRKLLILAGFLASSCFSGAQSDSAFADRNIVMIVLDTTRFDHLGMYGYGKDTTPFLDSLAEQAVVFDNAYSASSWTAPATASIFTSLYPDQHGVISGFFFYRHVNKADPTIHLNRMPKGQETLPEMLQKAGYRTFGVADNPNICERMGFSRGFDRFSSTFDEGGQHLNDQVLSWKTELNSGASPYFLYLHYMDPHKPYRVQEPYYQLEGTVAARDIKPAARYDSELGYTDALIRRLFEQLEIGPNTLVIVTADHGEEFGDHGSEGHDRGLYEELIHVPFFMVGRNSDGELDFKPGRVGQNVSTVDLLPTLRELLDQPAAEYTDGVSAAGILRGARDEADDLRLIFAHRAAELINENREYYSVSQGPWQLIENQKTRRRELFNLDNDKNAQNNLIKRRPRVRKRLLEELDRFRRRKVWHKRQFSDPMVLDQAAQDDLGRLGYSE